MTNLYFEEDGSFKAGTALSQTGNAYQVELTTGRRTKIKSSHVFFTFESPSAADLIARIPDAAAEPARPSLSITSPMVGTFYRAPSPGAAPFIEVGDQVKKGQVIGIIEAMKLLNEVEADKDGVVKAFAAENGQPVEYGQPLVILE